MTSPALEALNLIATPVWIVSPDGEAVIFANAAALDLSAESSLSQLRNGPYSARAHAHVRTYVSTLAAGQAVAEVWTVRREGRLAPLSVQYSPMVAADGGVALVVEGSQGGIAPTLPIDAEDADADLPCEECPHILGAQDLLFRNNTAPMLLIDPAQEGRIIDANPAACRFYGYPRARMRTLHTWQINVLGREVLPIMHEVARMPGGHRPLNFVHRLADGSTRHVQTYAGPVELVERRLLLCIIHDITEQKRLEQELEQAAMRDPLTGLWNRRQFLLQVDRACAHADRHGAPFCLMLIDADHFKHINDTHGHHTGDEVLVALGRTLGARLRECDALCRWGGEEFVILLPGTDLDGAHVLAESLRENVAALAAAPLPALTVSIGVAQSVPGEPIARLFQRVDEALYRAKEAGRNRVLVA